MKCNFRRNAAILRFGVFFFLGGVVGSTYDVCFRLIEKRVVDFILVLIDFFSPGITAEALRANID